MKHEFKADLCLILYCILWLENPDLAIGSPGKGSIGDYGNMKKNNNNNCPLLYER